jgi:hypothetical protein
MRWEIPSVSFANHCAYKGTGYGCIEDEEGDGESIIKVVTGDVWS